MTAQKSVVLFDYGFGNVRSAQRALERVGARVELTRDRSAAMRADGLVVPGVGAFAACMDGLIDAGGDQIVRDRLGVAAPVLGICVGAQVMFESGDEHGVRRDGVGVLSGQIVQLTADILPHMGWNTVEASPRSSLFKGIDPQSRFYFVHSFAALSAGPDTIVSTTTYGEPFVAAAEHGALSVTQFHPEKSADAGAALLANWMDTL
ncbi:imidazole glycerol phosphate synthase subunit HisH [Antricoccus suffuscus]|uniref:Imidazole glycerol phosphate synthase subunit HisH n=1 Tax=Antricoccus suffuscus TaxID=1629062 RepID=A0A2T0Z5Q4_9ACTN|nr:imidazole glycerol phosphate synthase subunit HisH [Antricoccus suffuscus]PRZ31691.1 imidazole glycerol phosphate synthase subunit HisH [Antricoccus suffuscus]